MNNISNEQVAAAVEGEGLGYALQHYMDVERIEDITLRNKCIRAKRLLDEIEATLKPYFSDGGDE